MNNLEYLLVNGDWLLAADYLRGHGYSAEAIHIIMDALLTPAA